MSTVVATGLANPSQPWDMEIIRNSVAACDLDGGLCGRLVGYWIGESDQGIVGTAWMCNMADAERFDVAFPLMLSMRWDEAGVVKSFDIDESFQGSQGITCSRSFIERRTRAHVVGVPLRTREPALVEPTNYGCRHVFELVYGLAGFKAFLQERQEKTGLFQESTISHRTDTGLELFDVIECMDRCTEVTVNAELDPGSIAFDRNGVLQGIGTVRVSAPSFVENGVTTAHPVPVGSFSGTTNSQVTAMAVRAFTPIWRWVSGHHGQARGLLCSTLWPPSMYSVLVQGLAQILFHNNFTYFQHCVAGLQRTTGKAKCIGCVRSFDEAASIFPEVRRDDFI
ncbi:hypothetical protein HMPREF1531_00704 [Propionibacterium sp. oral taxon 192 str. F0372]|uniref:hypothetical protein n=1 Tax=Propionibacterium sp. oral taxon 192 TaxID=671222 RepID=UPI0003527C04|nr:hypothetical protein [Propionibacterium sp. oral taxon 192]EPH06056.1 hypothetical protein HMPREF1531_00704 [Propionibacterium sp. oral taxon 192 str. F0372]